MKNDKLNDFFTYKMVEGLSDDDHDYEDDDYENYGDFDNDDDFDDDDYSNDFDDDF